MRTDYVARCLDLLPKLAQDQQRDVIEMMEEMVREKDTTHEGAPDRRAIVERTLGLLRDLPTSSDEFAREKLQEKTHEERKGRPA